MQRKRDVLVPIGEGWTRYGVTHPRPGRRYQPREGSDWNLPIPGTSRLTHAQRGDLSEILRVSPWGKHLRIQRLTIADPLGGKTVELSEGRRCDFQEGALGEIRAIEKAAGTTDGVRATRK